MAPRKKFILATTVRWSAFDVALLRYLQNVTHRNVVENVRAAIRIFARQEPNFNGDDFRRFIKSEFLSGDQKDFDKNQVLLEVDTFLQSFNANKKSDRDPLAPDLPDVHFRASASDFQFDD